MVVLVSVPPDLMALLIKIFFFSSQDHFRSFLATGRIQIKDVSTVDFLALWYLKTAFDSRMILLLFRGLVFEPCRVFASILSVNSSLKQCHLSCPVFFLKVNTLDLDLNQEASCFGQCWLENYVQFTSVLAVHVSAWQILCTEVLIIGFKKTL